MKKPGNPSGRRNKVEEALRLDESRLEALLKLDEMADAPLQDITRYAMEQGVRLTNSRIGYLAFMNEDETVLTMHSWSRTAMAECQIADKPIVYPMETVGLWGEAVRQRTPVVTNDYQSPNPLKKGYPSGHVAVTRHMNVPVFDGEKIVVVAGVGNKQEPYDDSDVRQLQLLMDGMWRLLQRKRIEETLRQSELKFKQLIETTGTGYVILDDQGRVADANMEYVRMTGRQRVEEILGRRVLEWTAPYDIERNDRAVRKCLTEGVVRNLEMDYVAPGGKVIPIEINATVLQAGGMVQILTLCRDVTDRKQAEEALRQAKDELEQRVAERTAELSHSRERLAMLFHTSPAAVFLSRMEDGRFLEVNDACLEILGYSSQEMIGRTSLELNLFVNPDDRQRAAGVLQRDGRIVNMEVQFRHRSGVPKTVLTNALPLDVDGVPCILGTLLNITERKQAERSLQRSEEMLNLIFRHSSDGINVVEFDAQRDRRKLVLCNDRYVEMSGYTREQLMAAEDLNLLSRANDDDEKTREYYGKIVHGVPTTGQSSWFRPDGKENYYEWTACSTREEGKIFIVGVDRDITEQKLAEGALRDSEMRYRLLFESSRDAMMTLGPPSWKLTAGNSAAVAMFGASDKSELVAMSPWEISPERQPDGCRSTDKAKEMIETAIREGSHFFEWTHKRMDGEGFPATVLLTRVEMAGQTFLQATVRDITVQKRAEEELKEANLGLEHSASRLRALTLELTRVEHQERRRIAELLHDHLQQLLVAAKLNVASMAQSKLEERDRDALHKAAAALNEAILQSKSLAVELNPPILREGGLAHALEWLGQRMRQTHEMAVKVEAQDDGGRIDQEFRIVLFNSVRELLFNVLKHANVKSSRVEMSMLPGHLVRIVVADRGSGFASKVTGSANDFESGLGLLAIRERLESLGGSMEIESRSGEGSRITLTAPLRPLVEAKKISLARRPKVRPDVSPTIKSDTAQKGIRVLLVDDHAMVRQSLAQMLSGVPEITVVAEASNGKEAVLLTRKLGPDVVVMDVNMPEMNGVEATRAIHAKWPEVLVIGLSMYHEPHRAEEMRQAGAVGYVNKSEVTETLIATIRACCKR